MPATYEPIASTTLGSDTATVTFSGISGSFTDLILVWCGQHASTVSASMGIRLNSDTGSNYSDTLLYGTGSTAASNRRSSASYQYVGEMAGTTAGYPTLILIHLMSYANTSINKTVLSAAADPSAIVTRGVGLWRSTAAITSITASIYGGGTNLKSGSTLSLYGVKAA